MSVGSTRRYYLLKGLEAERKGDRALASTWKRKQLDEGGTALEPSFPHRARLVAAGYVAVEDLVGATIEELQLIGLFRNEADAVLAALGRGQT